MTIMRLIGSVTCIAIFGFLLYRWYSGEVFRALVNLCILVVVSIPLFMTRFPALRQAALTLFGISGSAACLGSALLVSSNGTLWALLVLWVNALLLPRLWGLALNLVIIGVLAAHTELHANAVDHISWVAIAGLMAIFGLLFTRQLRAQRRQLAHQADRDPLTGVGNRRLMQRDLEAVIGERREDRREATLLVMDLDFFKQINDRHGHEAGDRVLVDFVTAVRALLREEDQIYRMGGEEFVILLRGMDAASAAAKLPQIQGDLRGRVRVADEVVSVSSGAATLTAGEDWSRWLARADRALYQAKESGRDRLIFAEAS